MFGRIALLGATLLGSLSSLTFPAAEVAVVLVLGVAAAFGFVRWYSCNDDELAAYAAELPEAAPDVGSAPSAP